MNTSIKLKDFEDQILFFNSMYKLPTPAIPGLTEQSKHELARDPVSCGSADPILSRLRAFKNIIMEEVQEVDDIVLSITVGYKCYKGEIVEPHTVYTELDCLTDLGDWLGDLQVFCASEMARYGLPIKEVLSIIMQSNFSKLGADGKPMYDERGKVKKGPGYWKPETQISAMLAERISEKNDKPTGTREIVWRDS